MAFGFQRKSSANPAAAAGQHSSGARVYSIAALLKDKSFAGRFEAAGNSYSFVYAPSRAETVKTRLQLTGRLTVSDSKGRRHSQDNVRATLAAIQGGIGNAPPRRQIPSARTPEAQSTQPGRVAEERAGVNSQRTDDRARDRMLPEVEASGALSFCGVMYLKLDSLDRRALGVSADLRQLQLNVRFAPSNDKERELHGVYSALIDALLGSPADQDAVSAMLVALNALLPPS